MNIIGIVCVGPNEYKRYLPEVLEDKARLCDKIIVLGDGLGESKSKEKNTVNLCKKFPNIEYRETKSELFNTKQWLLKQTALNIAEDYDPDWILAFDADELMDYRIDRQDLEDLTKMGFNSYEFNFVHLWNDRKHIRVDHGWRGLRKVIFYKYRPEIIQKFTRRSLHCGLAPIYAHKNSYITEYIVKHLGYMNPDDREKKINRYMKYDPNGFFKPQRWYDSILKEGEIIEFNEKKYVKTNRG